MSGKLIFISTIEPNIKTIPTYPIKVIYSFNRKTPATTATTTSIEVTMVVFEASIPFDIPVKTNICHCTYKQATWDSPQHKMTIAK